MYNIYRWSSIIYFDNTNNKQKTGLIMNKLFILLILCAPIFANAQTDTTTNSNTTKVSVKKTEKKLILKPKIGVRVIAGMAYDFVNKPSEVFAFPIAAGVVVTNHLYLEWGANIIAQNTYVLAQYRLPVSPRFPLAVYSSVGYGYANNSLSATTGLQYFVFDDKFIMSLGLTSSLQEWKPSLSLTIVKPLNIKIKK